MLFGLVHWSVGSLPIVFTDVALATLDGGYLWAHLPAITNVFLAWIAHLIADMVGIALLLIL